MLDQRREFILEILNIFSLFFGLFLEWFLVILNLILNSVEADSAPKLSKFD